MHLLVFAVPLIHKHQVQGSSVKMLGFVEHEQKQRSNTNTASGDAVLDVELS